MKKLGGAKISACGRLSTDVNRNPNHSVAQRLARPFERGPLAAQREVIAFRNIGLWNELARHPLDIPSQ